MEVGAFVKAHEVAWAELSRSVRGGGGADGARLVDLHRAVAADLAFAREHFPGTDLVEDLTELHAASYTIVYGGVGSVRGLRSSLGRTFRAGRRVVASASVALVSLVVVVVAGVVWASTDPVSATSVLGAGDHRELARGEATLAVPAVAVALTLAGAWLGGVGAVPGMVWIGTSVGVGLRVAHDSPAGIGDVLVLSAATLTVGVAVAVGPAAAAGWCWWRGGGRQDLRRRGVDAAIAFAAGVALCVAAYATAAAA